MKPIIEHLQLGIKQSITAFRYEADRFETPWHFHPEHELNLIESSSGTRFIGDDVSNYAPGELTLLRSNVPHCWKNNVIDGVPARSIVVQWTPGIFGTAPELIQLGALINDSAHGVQFLQVPPSLLTDIRSLPELTGVSLFVGLLSVLTRLAELNYSKKSTADLSGKTPKKSKYRMVAIHSYIEKNYSTKILLRDISTEVNMSEQSFSRFFSRVMGRPFFSFLNEYRTNIAGRMLTETTKSVGEIGYACGYDSPPFFHQQFLKYQGCSPGRYRKKFTS